MFTRLTSEHPEEWLGWYGLARVQVLQEDRVGAKSSLEQALSRAAQPGQKGGIRRMLERLAAGQTIG